MRPYIPKTLRKPVMHRTPRRSIMTKAAAFAAKNVYTKEGSPYLSGFGVATRVRKGHVFINEPPANDIAAWKNDKQIVLSVRGSDHETDWTFNNLPIALNYTPMRYWPTERFILEVISQHRGLLPILVGHSLGGGLVQLLCAKHGFKGVTFNAPPMRSVIDGRIRFDIGLTNQQQDVARDTDLVVNYTTTYDPVSKVPGLFVGTNKKLFLPEYNPLTAHSMDSVLKAMDLNANISLAEEKH